MIPSLAKLCSPRNSTIRIIRHGTFPSDLDLFAQFFTFCDVAETEEEGKKKKKIFEPRKLESSANYGER